MPPLGAAKAAGHRDQVELRKRIFHAEIAVVVSEQLDGVLQRKAPGTLRGRIIGIKQAEAKGIDLRREKDAQADRCTLVDRARARAIWRLEGKAGLDRLYMYIDT
jgi:hypothetical protein